jgi:demethylmenaquinone methyltransferase/2-methoxy-6-polyprenyl-1,4-benzoquinol methylase
LPFYDNSFDAVTEAFGVRNFENRAQGLSEIRRVLKPNRQVVILEFSMPEKFPMKQLYRLYFKHFLPKIGKYVSKDPKAYTYLPQSVEAFPKPSDFIRILDENGLKNGSVMRLSFGIATLYIATK